MIGHDEGGLIGLSPQLLQAAFDQGDLLRNRFVCASDHIKRESADLQAEFEALFDLLGAQVALHLPTKLNAEIPRCHLRDAFVPTLIRYASPERVVREMRSLFHGTPLIAAHGCELPGPGDFLTRSLSGLPLLMTRDRDGAVHAFLNVCRHRGARLVADEKGCRNSFSCPYHAWTWSNRGELRGIPHGQSGFPDLDRTEFGLRRLPAEERHGLIWVLPDPDGSTDFEAFSAPLAKEFEWIGMPDLAVADSERFDIDANWKILVEGGIEAYHFKVAHRDTIGPHFQDNLSSYAMFGPHMRSVLPRLSLDTVHDLSPEKRSIRDHVNVLYSVFPTKQFLVMQDHVAWISLDPLSESRTTVRIATLAPSAEVTQDRADHWRRNHAITRMTLAEDFEIGAAVQAGLSSGANGSLTFGRYEGALNRFNQAVEAALA